MKFSDYIQMQDFNGVWLQSGYNKDRAQTSPMRYILTLAEVVSFLRVENQET